MRINAASLAAWSGAFALTLATAGVAATGAGTVTTTPGTEVAGPAAATLPSIDVPQRGQSGLAGTCGGSTFNLDTVINVGAQASADVKVSAPGVGTLEEFTDETGKNIGPYHAKFPTFEIPAFGGGLAPNTLITVTITTYSGPGLTGNASFTSKITFNCTTGKVLAAAIDPTAQVPTLSWPALVASMALLGLLGMATLRRRNLSPQKR